MQTPEPMNEIFVSYDRSDRNRALLLVEFLSSQGWSIWWDAVIPHGVRFDEVIERALADARCVVVLWSRESIKSRWVRSEASEGADREILFPALLEKVIPPLQFRTIQSADLSDWHGNPTHPEIRKLVEAIQMKLGVAPGVADRRKSSRPEEVKERPPAEGPQSQRRAKLPTPTPGSHKPRLSHAHITFVHGISRKPAPATLLKNWRQALGRDEGLALAAQGITSSMVYFADVLYGELADSQSAQETLDGTNPSLTTSFGREWREELAGSEENWVEDFAEKLRLNEADGDTLPDVSGDNDPNQPAVLWRLTRPLMEMFLRDVHHYLFNTEHSPRPGVTYLVQDEIRARMLKELEQAASRPGPHILVSHSIGTVIAYDCLKRVPSCPKIDAFITLGSPLGMEAIRHKLRPEYSGEEGFPSRRLSGPWVNVYDALDPVVGDDPEIASHYRRKSELVVEDLHEPNFGGWRHDIQKYLQGPLLRARLEQLLVRS
jgi:TIR domain